MKKYIEHRKEKLHYFSSLVFRSMKAKQHMALSLLAQQIIEKREDNEKEQHSDSNEDGSD